MIRVITIKSRAGKMKEYNNLCITGNFSFKLSIFCRKSPINTIVNKAKKGMAVFAHTGKEGHSIITAKPSSDKKNKNHETKNNKRYIFALFCLLITKKTL